MNTDCHYLIGRTHAVCQDYAISEALENKAIAIVSDGCSASPNSDVGARMLSLSLMRALKKGCTQEDLHLGNILLYTTYFCDDLIPSSDCLDATLLCAVVEEGKFFFKAAGDGFFIKIMKDQTLQLTQIEFPSGAPYYTSYLNNSVRHEGYRETFGTQKHIKKWLFKDNLLRLVEEIIVNDQMIYQEEGDTSELTAVLVSTDGLNSFYQSIKTQTSKSNVPIPLEQVLSELFSFKSYKGSFIRRRMQAFKTANESSNWNHADDLSLAGIFL